MKPNDGVNVLKNLIYKPLTVEVDYSNVSQDYEVYYKGNNPTVFLNGFHEADLKIAFELVLKDINEKDKRIEELESTIGFLKKVINNA